MVLTNGLIWEIHRVSVEDKLVNEKVIELNFAELNPRKSLDQEMLFMLCRRGVAKDLMSELYEYKQSVNRYTIGALILSDPLISLMKRELRKLKSGIKINDEQLVSIIKDEVLKRELLESDAAKEANRSIQKMLKKEKRKRVSHKRKPVSPKKEDENIV